MICPNCKSTAVTRDNRLTLKMATCRDCGHRWNPETGEPYAAPN